MPRFSAAAQKAEAEEAARLKAEAEEAARLKAEAEEAARLKAEAEAEAMADALNKSKNNVIEDFFRVRKPRRRRRR